MLVELIQIYVAIWIVVLLHEIGHLPKHIKFNKSIIPGASAMDSKSRYGGLVVNALLFIGVFYYKPETLLLQLVGLVAWVHFIIYAILGSIIPEVDPNKVNVNTYVFDDVPNEYWYVFITLGILTFCYFKEFYLSIIGGII